MHVYVLKCMSMSWNTCLCGGNTWLCCGSACICGEVHVYVMEVHVYVVETHDCVVEVHVYVVETHVYVVECMSMWWKCMFSLLFNYTLFTSVFVLPRPSRVRLHVLWLQHIATSPGSSSNSMHDVSMTCPRQLVLPPGVHKCVQVTHAVMAVACISSLQYHGMFLPLSCI